MHTRFFLTVAAAGIVCAHSFAAQPAAAQAKPATQARPAAPAGPWAKVPALPTACYQEGDTFYAKLEAAQAAVATDEERQEAINQNIADQLSNIDPMEKAARMQQWMMSNPQEAMAYMQGIQSAGAEDPARIAADQQQEAKFRSDRTALMASYQAAIKTLNAPMDAKYSAFHKRILDKHGCDWGEHGCGAALPALPEYNAIQQERDAAYAAACPGWWGPTGQITAFMKRYKDWLTGTHVPFLVSLEVHRTNQYAIFNTPAASYRSTESFKAAHEYMNAAYPLYQLRRQRPHCGPRGCE